MKKVFSFIFLLSLFYSCAIGQEKGTDLQLTSEKYKKMIDRTIDFTIPLVSVEELHANMEEYVILDAREMEEYKVSHIPKAIYVGYDDPELGLIKSIDKDKKLLFYCSIGYRSEKIGEKAKEMGFKEVYNLYGSIFEWANKGYELEDASKKETKKIHGYNWLWGRWIDNDSYEKVY
jgi:rhodanese-related sulfurtransferase